MSGDVTVGRNERGSWCVYVDGRFISDHATHVGARTAAQNIAKAEAAAPASAWGGRPGATDMSGERFGFHGGPLDATWLARDIAETVPEVNAKVRRDEWRADLKGRVRDRLAARGVGERDADRERP